MTVGGCVRILPSFMSCQCNIWQADVVARLASGLRPGSLKNQSGDPAIAQPGESGSDY